MQPDDATPNRASGADWNRGFYQVPTNQSGKDAWPLDLATFIIMHKIETSRPKGTATLKFFSGPSRKTTSWRQTSPNTMPDARRREGPEPQRPGLKSGWCYKPVWPVILVWLLS